MTSVLRFVLCLGLLLSICISPPAIAQVAAPATPTTDAAPAEPPQPEREVPNAPAKVDVQPVARDDEIRIRLLRILTATDWFDEPRVRVDEGVVFLDGTAETDEYRTWATNLAHSTQDVVAVVNQMRVYKPKVWNFRPAMEGVTELWEQTLRWLPFIAFGLVILLATVVAARLTRNLMRRFFASRIEVPLLREVIARGCAMTVFVLGLYVVLRVSGLTRLALTVVGGTGLVGLVIGIAFRDITENFLASVFLSMQRPFRSGDLVEIVAITGYVERLTIRTTIITTLDGNHAQIPNATVYKSTIRNFTSNPNRREEFSLAVGLQVAIADAQKLALDILRQHPAVLAEPEPWVLADSLAVPNVMLKVYFWLDGRQHSWLKVRSSVIRQVKRAFQDAGYLVPAGPQAVVFPNRLDVQLVEGEKRNGGPAAKTPVASKSRKEPVTTAAEGGLDSDAEQIEEQGRVERAADVGADLLKDGAQRGS